MNKILLAICLAVGLFVGILVMLEAGRRIGAVRLAREPDGGHTRTGAVEGAVFGLVGLLIAFTFSGAATRFDARRDLIIQEINAIGTAYLRLDLLPASTQPPLREHFRQYLDARIHSYRKLPDVQAALAEEAQAVMLQGKIWREVIAAGQLGGGSPDAIKLLLPALNDMFDISATRTMTTEMHPPLIIYLMLTVLTLAGALLAGYGMVGKRRDWLHILGFAAAMAGAVYIIIDIEYPRMGLVRVDAFDHGLVDLRASMR